MTLEQRKKAFKRAYRELGKGWERNWQGRWDRQTYLSGFAKAVTVIDSELANALQGEGFVFPKEGEKE